MISPKGSDISHKPLTLLVNGMLTVNSTPIDNVDSLFDGEFFETTANETNLYSTRHLTCGSPVTLKKQCNKKSNVIHAKSKWNLQL